MLTTVLFTDVVDSTGRLLELGDRTWTELLRSHQTRFRERLGRFGGREVDAAGDGFLAAFDVPTYAVAFACSFHDEVIELGLEVAPVSTRASVSSRTAGSAAWRSTWVLAWRASHAPARSSSRQPFETWWREAS